MTAALKTKQKICPIDGTAMRELRYENDVVDLCESCHGIWCDDEELRNIIQTIEKEFQTSDFKPSTPSRARSEVRTCPTCDSALHENNFRYSSGILIDRCPSGHGVWLDYVELEKIQVFSEKWEKAHEKTKLKYSKTLSIAKTEAIKGFDKGQRSKTKNKMNDSFIEKLLNRFFA